MDAVNPNQTKLELTGIERARLLTEVRSLTSAPLQKLWLPSPHLAVLQLRVPGKNVLVVVDARLALAAIAPERPAAIDAAPPSQATLRSALSGARLESVRLERASDRGLRGPPSVRLSFATPRGPRALISEPEPEPGGALFLLGAGEKIVWAASGASAGRRPGAIYPEAREELPEIDLAPPAQAAASQTAAPQTDDRLLVARALAQDADLRVAARKRSLLAQLSARVKKLTRAVAAVAEDAERAAGADEDRRHAELLLPHQGQIERGKREVVVPDWSLLDESGAPTQVTLALDPALSAAQNAARWLKRSKRYQAAKGRIAARRAEVALALADAQAKLARAAALQDGEGLRALEEELGTSPAQREKSAQRATVRLPYRSFRSQSGARILVGRSARDNDALTLRIARGNDLWLHARGMQGSHVVVPLPSSQTEPDARTLIDAALLALHFSSARDQELAEVAWTRRKHVRKPKGAKPGSVIVSQEKTLRLRREPERLAALLAGEER